MRYKVSRYTILITSIFLPTMGEPFIILLTILDKSCKKIGDPRTIGREVAENKDSLLY